MIVIECERTSGSDLRIRQESEWSLRPQLKSGNRVGEAISLCYTAVKFTIDHHSNLKKAQQITFREIEALTPDVSARARSTASH
ncbi:hypothetical protein EVAR_93651_1 [Eumeta japonica]|uniref:Uncharacterized protein n=1 Tax=Eumeta variegata TaxID=151549 RepID=A0A4C1TQM4_EUMVA|nr:hypothetical protein EVAR_93651_1 [Eumeta japonica]